MNGYVDRRRALAEAFEILGQLAEDANRLAYRAADVDDDLLSRHVERVRAAIVSAGDRTARMQRAETDALVDQLESTGRHGPRDAGQNQPLEGSLTQWPLTPWTPQVGPRSATSR